MNSFPRCAAHSSVRPAPNHFVEPQGGGAPDRSQPSAVPAPLPSRGLPPRERLQQSEEAELDRLLGRLGTYKAGQRVAGRGRAMASERIKSTAPTAHNSQANPTHPAYGQVHGCTAKPLLPKKTF